jgi:hypothetical protein
MHDEEERLALYASFVRAPWSTLPTSLPIDAFKDYFGEKQALLMRFMGHVTNGYMGMAVVGVVVQIRVFVAADSRPAVELAGVYSLILCLWSVFQTEYWKRTERETALLWGTVGFEDQELVRPQFKGIRMLDPVTGRRGVFFPPAKRSARVAASFFATFACIAGNLAFLSGQDKGDSTSLQRECSARARSGNSTHASRALREMIARPKISRNERKMAEI